MSVNIQFNSNIDFNTPRNAVKKQILADTTNFFGQHPHYTQAQKNVLNKRLPNIVKQAQKNAHLKDLPKNDNEFTDFCKAISDVVVSVNSPFHIPECKKNRSFRSGHISVAADRAGGLEKDAEFQSFFSISSLEKSRAFTRNTAYVSESHEENGKTV